MSKTNNIEIISVSSEKSFIIAKAFLPYIDDWKQLSSRINGRSGYNLYYENSAQQWELFEKDNEGFIKRLKKEEKRSLTLYWIKDNITLRIPFGFCENEGLRGNGVVELKVNDGKDKLEKFTKNFQDNNWESHRIGTINYQYLTEYFIDSTYSQNGLSLTLREIIKHLLRKNFKNNFDIENAGEEKIKQILDDYLKEYGLVVVANTVSYSSFKKNSGAEGENK